MSNRTEELANQAGLDWENLTWTQQRDLQKFAKLLVNECADFARQHNLERAERSFMVHTAIKRHFGTDK